MTIVPIAEQLAEVEREVRNRARYYPGRLTREVAERKLRDLSAAAATMRIIVEHADGLRPLIAYLRREAASETPAAVPDADDTAALLAHPAVAELLVAFPDAVLAGIAPVAITAPAASTSDAAEHEEAA